MQQLCVKEETKNTPRANKKKKNINKKVSTIK